MVWRRCEELESAIWSGAYGRAMASPLSPLPGSLCAVPKIRISIRLPFSAPIQVLNRLRSSPITYGAGTSKSSSRRHALISASRPNASGLIVLLNALRPRYLVSSVSSLSLPRNFILITFHCTLRPGIRKPTPPIQMCWQQFVLMCGAPSQLSHLLPTPSCV